MQLRWTAQQTVPGYGHCQKSPQHASVLLASAHPASTMQLSGRSTRASRPVSWLAE